MCATLTSVGTKRVSKPLAPDDPRHGTTAGYESGCHEECCRKAIREKRSAERRAAGIPKWEEKGYHCISEVDEESSTGFCSLCNQRVKVWRQLKGWACGVQKANYSKQRQASLRHDEVVYFVLAPAAGLMKIGKTNSVQLNLTALRRGSPVELQLWATIPGGLKKERELHKKFADVREHGEWFHAGTVEEWLLTEGAMLEGYVEYPGLCSWEAREKIVDTTAA